MPCVETTLRHMCSNLRRSVIRPARFLGRTIPSRKDDAFRVNRGTYKLSGVHVSLYDTPSVRCDHRTSEFAPR